MSLEEELNPLDRDRGTFGMRRVLDRCDYQDSDSQQCEDNDPDDLGSHLPKKRTLKPLTQILHVFTSFRLYAYIVWRNLPPPTPTRSKQQRRPQDVLPMQ